MYYYRRDILLCIHAIKLSKLSILTNLKFCGQNFWTALSSPAVKLGFTNITKLAKWTSGCSTDDDTEDYQFIIGNRVSNAVSSILNLIDVLIEMIKLL